ANDVCVHTRGRADTNHFRQKRFIASDQFTRNASRPQDFLAMVYVVKKRVKCLDSLLYSLREFAPLTAGDDSRYDIEGDKPLCSLFFAIDGKGDSGASKN